MLRTTNAGTNWSIIFNQYAFSSFYFLNSQTGWLIDATAHTLESTINGGSSWNNIFFSCSCPTADMKFANQLTGWICGSGIFGTSDGGLNWTLQYSNASFNAISFVSELTGWAAGDAGRIFKTTTGGITNLQQISGEVPEHYSLFQNYPNPFNPTTKIKFNIPPPPPDPHEGGNIGQEVSLKIYDILGRDAATLVNEQLKAGIYEIEFDGSNYASGIYFYKLVTERYTETKEMVLIK